VPADLRNVTGPSSSNVTCLSSARESSMLAGSLLGQVLGRLDLQLAAAQHHRAVAGATHRAPIFSDDLAPDSTNITAPCPFASSRSSVQSVHRF
jgi:hypothetical protein